MNRTYYDINRSQLNNSTAKQIYAFPKSSRFGRTFQSPCNNHSYLNHSFQNVRTKTPTFCKSPRFSFKANQNPSPMTYNITDFIQQSKVNKKGAPFYKTQRIPNINNQNPGPSSYNAVINPQKNLSYTMRAKPKNNNTSWNVVGPGQYDPDTNLLKYVDSRYKNTTTGALSKSLRFLKIDKNVPGPGKYQWQKAFEVSRLQTQPVSKYKNNGKYTFGKDHKMTMSISQRNKLNDPGPGQYQGFSEFAQLQKPISRNRFY